MPRVTITVPEKNAQPYRFQLDRESVTLGRGSDNDIAIDCGSVSGKHAEMRRVEGGYELRDLGSTNGIKLDGERYETIPLHNGISVKLGDVAFDFVLADEELEALAREQPNDASPGLPESGKSLPKLPPLREEAQRPGAVLPPPGNKYISGYGMLLLFVLAVMAFCVGMAIRFQKETGGSLIDAIKAKRQPMSAPAATAPAAAVPAAAVPDTAVPDTAVPAAVPAATPGAGEPQQ